MTDTETTATEGSLVFAYALDGAGGCLPADAADRGGPHWHHLDYSKEGAAEQLTALGLEPALVESLTRTDSRPRTLELAGGLLVILRGVNTNPGADPEDMVSLRLWIEPQRLISVRQYRLLSVQDLRAELLAGHGPRSIPALVVSLVQRLADRIAGFVDSIEEQVETFEEALATGISAELRTGISALRRQTAKVRRFLAPQREALEVLARLARQHLGEEHAAGLREQSDRIARYVEDLDLVRERAVVLHEELLNRNAEQQNARMYLLSIVTTIFLPITFITGLFGMNVAGLPGTEDSRAFEIVVLIMLALLVAVVVWMRRRRWL
jgi:zinc transporter